MVFAPQCTLEPVLNLCVVEDFCLFSKCEEATTFLYPGLIVGNILHEKGWMGVGVGIRWFSKYFYYRIENIALKYAIKQESSVHKTRQKNK